MNYGLVMPDVNALWAEARREEDGTYSARSVSDEAERAYWKDVISHFSVHAPNRYSREILDCVLSIMRPRGVRTVTEIGPGWGNYTIDLAQRMDVVHAVDLSRDNLDYVTRDDAGMGLNNIVGHWSKWEDYEAPQKTDAVFGYNCFYRMPDLVGAMKKVNDSAEKLCVVGMTTGPEQDYYMALKKELGLGIRFDHQDYIHLVLALDALRVAPNLVMLPLTAHYDFDSDEALVRHAAERITDARYDAKSVLKVMAPFFRRDEAGYHFDHPFYASVIYWTPVRR